MNKKINFHFVMLIICLAVICFAFCAIMKGKGISETKYISETSSVLTAKKSITQSEQEQQKLLVESVIKSVSSDEIENDMKWLVNTIGVRNWWDDTQNKAGDKLFEKLLTYGYSDGNLNKTDFQKGKRTGRNISAVIKSKAENAPVLLVMAHYDTVKSTSGAVDNSSGVATLLQLAKIFKKYEKDFGVEIRFVFTAGEEQGYYGSYAYVENMSKDEKERLKFVFNMDMTGKPNDAYEKGREYFLSVSTEPVSRHGYVSPKAQKNIGSNAVDKIKDILGNLGEAAYYSPVRAGKHDILPFRKEAIDALTISWRSIATAEEKANKLEIYEEDKTQENPVENDYDLCSPALIHTKDDNLQNFDMQSLINTTRLAAGSVAELIINLK